MKNRLQPGSVVLTDLSAGVESLPEKAEEFLCQIAVLALLYDEVLIQDEVLALSKKLARWMVGPEYLRILKECLDLGLVRILTHPERAYPPELREQAEKNPILARANYIEKYSTKGQRDFHPTKKQQAFYEEFSFLKPSESIGCRPVGSQARLDLLDVRKTFGVILRDVLSEGLYSQWRRQAFNGVSSAMAQDFIGYIEHPEIAWARLRDVGRDVSHYDENAEPVFTRSLGYQVAYEFYSPRQANAMARLIQSAFAAPFCCSENAVGRYGKGLRELLWLPEGSVIEHCGPLDIVSLETEVVPLHIPPLQSFPKIVASVRGTDAGKALRKAVKNLGADTTFTKQREAWNAVAEEVATRIYPCGKFRVGITMMNIGGETFWGAIAGGVLGALSQEAVNVQWVGSSAVVGALVSVGGNLALSVLRKSLKRQKLRCSLEEAVQFRCSYLDLPPLVDGDAPEV